MLTAASLSALDDQCASPARHKRRNENSSDAHPSAAAAAPSASATTSATAAAAETEQSAPEHIAKRARRDETEPLTVDIPQLQQPALADLLKTKFTDLWFGAREDIAPEVHTQAREALDVLQQTGVFNDMALRLREPDAVSRTAVKRLLLGEPGLTFRVMDLRLFALPWSDLSETDAAALAAAAERHPNIERMTAGLHKIAKVLADTAKVEIERRTTDLIREHTPQPQSPAGDEAATAAGTSLLSIPPITAPLLAGHPLWKQSDQLVAGTEFNACMLNLYDPADMPDTDLQDDLLGRGKLAMGWNSDTFIDASSTIGVYICLPEEAEQRERRLSMSANGAAAAAAAASTNAQPEVSSSSTPAAPTLTLSKDNSGDADADEHDSAVEMDTSDSGAWAVGFRAKSDGTAPPLLAHLRSGDIYLMLQGFTEHHQRALYAGHAKRIACICRKIDNSPLSSGTRDYIVNLCNSAIADALISGSHFDLMSVTKVQQALTEVECGWIRQFWAHGLRHARIQAFWKRVIESLELQWQQLESLTRQSLDSITRHMSEALHTATKSENARIATICDALLKAFEHRLRLREQWANFYSSPDFDHMENDLLPVRRPHFSASSPLPEALEPKIAQLVKYIALLDDRIAAYEA
ncbi:hypothetical protein CAOG_04002 [Capsaspora owczarzaki ATCC 30864]|uniref:Alpha-ketoglutarate-dependent dioxygenase FTO n=1 Tax=Capsaspora owczarzaki (strain ATCC 30864) TaxID=595528 RepID=A0A0D2UDP8_CAPO3|nr:hypothetical protein CAOG_04002 [Capsaspora owczarzaki ATCC 30864]KJE93176.1 hypothetical protein CAOG_004002 [Capsaspora owczarzaki ATCC 30864]|eukprot:XP_004347827.1 hypothetical protein CAOG_04002 [Capsaspora owczarzaki ATCC 30864]